MDAFIQFQLEKRVACCVASKHTVRHQDPFAQESLNAGTYTDEPILKTKLSFSDFASKLDALAAKNPL